MEPSPNSATRYSAYPSGCSAYGKRCGPYSIVSVLLFCFFVWYIFDPPDRFVDVSPTSTSIESESEPVHHSKTSLRPDSHLCNEDDALGHVLPASSHARCLDGSLPMFYHRKGKGEGKHKWAIYFEGGGWCYSLEACKQRAKTPLGSSSSYPRCLSKDAMQNYISPLRSANPMMSGWNVVRVRYCDGGSYAGNAVADVNGTKLYFRGQTNRDETLRALLPLGLREAKEVVFLGCSAGALGIYLGIDALAHLVHTEVGAHVTVRGLAVSGFFMEYSSLQPVDVAEATRFGSLKDDGLVDGRLDYAYSMEQLFDMMNLTAGANAACVHAMHTAGKAAHKCIFAKHLLPHVRTPVFSVQSQYDHWQVLHIYGRNYTSQAVNTYGRHLSTHLLHASLGAMPNSTHGVFIESCAHHCVSCSNTEEDTWNGARVVARSGADGGRYSPAQAFKAWYAQSVSTPQPWSWVATTASQEGAEGNEVSETATVAYREGGQQGPGDALSARYAHWERSYQLFVQNASYPCHSCCSCAIR